MWQKGCPLASSPDVEWVSSPRNINNKGWKQRLRHFYPNFCRWHQQTVEEIEKPIRAGHIHILQHEIHPPQPPLSAATKDGQDQKTAPKPANRCASKVKTLNFKLLGGYSEKEKGARGRRCGLNLRPTLTHTHTFWPKCRRGGNCLPFPTKTWGNYEIHTGRQFSPTSNSVAANSAKLQWSLDNAESIYNIRGLNINTLTKRGWDLQCTF